MQLPGLGLKRKDMVQRAKPHKHSSGSTLADGQCPQPSTPGSEQPATKEPNWLAGMSLPLLENKIKNRECAQLLNGTQRWGKGSCLWQNVPGRSARPGRPTRIWVECGGRGMAPQLLCPRQPPQAWQKHFQNEKPGSPQLERPCLISIGPALPSPWQILGLL